MNIFYEVNIYHSFRVQLEKGSACCAVGVGIHKMSFILQVFDNFENLSFVSDVVNFELHYISLSQVQSYLSSIDSFEWKTAKS